MSSADEDQAGKVTRDPVAPARRSTAAEEKASSKQPDDGTPVHRFHTLLKELATIVRSADRFYIPDVDNTQRPAAPRPVS
jgi:hypothetical protein